MIKTIGVIGCGNMGGALLAGFAAKLNSKEWRLMACSRTPAKAEAFAPLGIKIAPDIPALVRDSDLIILAVKPYQIAEVIQQAKPFLNKTKTIISIAAGISLASLRDFAGEDCAVSRCMPTTTAMAGRGIFAFCFDSDDPANEAILALFGRLGLCLALPEDRFTDFSALIGAGPAYVFACMRGLAQAGLTIGFNLAQCRQMLIELFAGCAELARMNDKNFTQLRDDVCSPAGLTIAGVNVLDRAGLSGLMVDAVLAAQKRGHEMES